MTLALAVAEKRRIARAVKTHVGHCLPFRGSDPGMLRGGSRDCFEMSDFGAVSFASFSFFLFFVCF